MRTISLGPLSLSSLVLMCVVAIVVAMAVGAAFDRKRGTSVESMLWKTFLTAVIAGRVVFVALHFQSYSKAPISIIDIRDGGFSVVAAIAVVAFIGIMLAWRKTLARRPLVLSLAAGFSVLGMGYAALNLLDPPGQVINNVTFSSLDGDLVELDDFRGKPTVVNLWASWCPPCRREMPALQQGQNDNPDINFVFANQRETEQQVYDYLTSENLTLDNVVMDKPGALAQDIKSSGLPTTLFLDRDGKLVDIRLGELSVATLNDRLDALRRGASIGRKTKE